MKDLSDPRRWFLKVSDETVYGSVTLRTLIFWAERGGIHPGYRVSCDREHWVEAAGMPELAMDWCVVTPGGEICGPLNRVAAERFLAENRFPEGSVIQARTALPEEQFRLPEFPADWVYPSDAAVAGHDAFLSGWSELRSQNLELQAVKAGLETTIAEMAAEKAALEAALAIEKKRAAEVQHAFQEQLERATLLDREHEERRSALKQEPPAPYAASSDTAALYAVLAQEAQVLEQFADQELRLLDEIRALSVTRRQEYAARIQAIRAIAGENPEAMRRKAQSRTGSSSAVSRLDYQQLSREAQERETELQRRVQALETREVHLRKEIDKTRAQVGNTLELQARLQETEQKLEQETAGRQHDRRDADHIQNRLVARIEELERRIAQGRL